MPGGHRPAVSEAEERLAELRDNGPSPDAFTFRRHFPAPDSAEAEAVEDHLDLCPA